MEVLQTSALPLGYAARQPRILSFVSLIRQPLTSEVATFGLRPKSAKN